MTHTLLPAKIVYVTTSAHFWDLIHTLRMDFQLNFVQSKQPNKKAIVFAM